MAAPQQVVVRQRGAELRQALVANRINYGDPIGDAVCRRLVWEVLENVAETHGRARAVELVYAVADAYVHVDKMKGLEAISKEGIVAGEESTGVTITSKDLSGAIAAGVTAAVEGALERVTPTRTRLQRLRCTLEANVLSVAALTAFITALLCRGVS